MFEFSVKLGNCGSGMIFTHLLTSETGFLSQKCRLATPAFFYLLKLKLLSCTLSYLSINDKSCLQTVQKSATRIKAPFLHRPTVYLQTVRSIVETNDMLHHADSSLNTIKPVSLLTRLTKTDGNTTFVGGPFSADSSVIQCL